MFSQSDLIKPLSGNTCFPGRFRYAEDENEQPSFQRAYAVLRQGTVCGLRYTARLPAREPAFTGWVSGSVLPEAQWDTAWLRKLLIRLKSQGHFHIAKVTIRILPMKPDERHFRVCQSALPGTE